MANLLPTTDISGTIILVYDIQVVYIEGKFFMYLYTTFIFFLQICSSIATVLFRYLFHLETATLKL